MNRVELKLFGYERHEMVGRPMWLFASDSEASEVRVKGKLAETIPVSVNGERVYVRKDGTTFPAIIDESYIRDQSGKVAGIRTVVRDGTERKRIMKKIQEQAALLDKTHDAISVMNLKDGIVYWNRGAEELYGWKSSEVLGKNQWELSRKEDDTTEEPVKDARPIDLNGIHFIDQTHRIALTTTLAEGKWNGELQQKTRTGKGIVVMSDWALIKDKNGTPQSILFISTDITERKALEEQYRRAQRMDMLGALASGIAHDLNNVLSPIGLAIDMLQRNYGSDPKTARLLSTLETTVKRGTGVVKQILAFATGAESRRERLDPIKVLEDVRRIIDDAFPKNILRAVTVDKGTDLLIGDRTQIHQILMKLCINARDAMPGGGKLSLSARNVIVDEQYAGMSRGAKAGNYVLLEVMDTGVGIKKENMENLFDPFFTTKEADKGTGLGLAMVRGLVESHGGFIELSSEVHKGSTFRVYLPAASPGEHVSQPVPELKLRLGQGELILVADDELAIREITKMTLEAHGYGVLVASDGSEAVSLYAQHRHEVSLVVTDMLMPIMDGTATLSALRKINPEVKVIVVTGYVDTEDTTQLSGTVNAILRKPYSAAELMRAVNDVLSPTDI
jgi:hypothetical protein